MPYIFVFTFIIQQITFLNIPIKYYSYSYSSFNTVELYGRSFPPLKVYCYDLPEKYHPNNSFLQNYMYSPNGVEFKYYIEVEVHLELLLSPLLTKNPEEANFFYIPVYPFAMFSNPNSTKLNFSELITELRRIGPWFDRKNGADHIMTSGYDILWFGNEFVTAFLSTKIILCALYPIIRYSWQEYEYKRFIIVPHISFFPKYPFDKVDWEKPRKNKVFIAQTYQSGYHANKLRWKMVKAIRKIKNHDILIFTRDENDVVKNVQSLPEHYMNSDFCLCPKGDNPIAKRNYDGPHFGCIPVYLSDNVALPYSGNLLDYSKFSIRIPQEDVKLIPQILESYSQEEIYRMRKELRKCALTYLFRLGEPPRVGEGFWAISWMWYTRFIYAQQFDYKYYPIPRINISKNK